MFATPWICWKNLFENIRMVKISVDDEVCDFVFDKICLRT